jgi:hypothetical protein
VRASHKAAGANTFPVAPLIRWQVSGFSPRSFAGQYALKENRTHPSYIRRCPIRPRLRLRINELDLAPIREREQSSRKHAAPYKSAGADTFPAFALASRQTQKIWLKKLARRIRADPS